ncbi:NUMOD4 motif-containing HNH endonuclease [Microbacterium luteum]|uniref:NUMOD4 motif-containing HNH endonuclease n=1 Tax=Microbacterium luteum TaxID=2782167 RepID=UPI0018873265|nr:NUMOD4 motif-containing HNH endonuclease [Microbacterium luteum]
MQTTESTLKADFLAARTARGISLKNAAKEIGCAFSIIVRMNRGVSISPESEARIREWTDRQPKTPADHIPGEEWRPVIGWEGIYEVSDHGRVRSVERTIPHGSGFPMVRVSHVLRPGSLRKAGHQLVCLMDGVGGRKQSRYVHQLVLEAFVGPMPEGMEGCHYDGDPRNNRLENLRWDTHAGNMQDAVRHGTHPGFKNRKDLIQSRRDAS